MQLLEFDESKASADSSKEESDAKSSKKDEWVEALRKTMLLIHKRNTVIFWECPYLS